MDKKTPTKPAEVSKAPSTTPEKSAPPEKVEEAKPVQPSAEKPTTPMSAVDLQKVIEFDGSDHH